MKKLSTLIAIVLLIPLLISQKPPQNGDRQYVEGQIMVQLRSNNAPWRQQQMLDDVLADFKSVNLEMVEKLSQRMNIFLLSYNPVKIDDNRLLEEIKAQPNVEFAQFNHYIQQRDLIPSDEFFGLQWNMYNIGQTGGTTDADIDGPEAWDLGTSGVTATGDTIIVAIVDGGFDLGHEDLKFWKNYHEIPGNLIDDDSNGYIDDYDGWNVYNSSGEIIEQDHGTHVAGIAAAQGNNSVGVAGVNLHVQLMPVVASSTIESIAVAGYAYILEMRSLYNETGGEKGAFVVSTNCSFGVDGGQPEDYPIWGAMYDSLGMEGILSSGATANANFNVDVTGDIPTAFPSDYLITVTNTDKNDVKSDFAAYGLTTIDLGAPGTAVYSTRLTSNGGYGYKTGTSMAAPHVAGAVAYMFSVANLGFMTEYHNNPDSMALLIKQYLLESTDSLPSLVGKTVTGGRLNIYKAALKIALSLTITSDQQAICSGNSAHITSEVSGGTGVFDYSWTSVPVGFVSSEANVVVEPVVTTTYFLEVTNGPYLLRDSIKIDVNPLPEKPVIASGPAIVDNFTTATSLYECSEVVNGLTYQWFVTPVEAGTSASTGAEGEFTWTDGFTGPVLVSVINANECGNSPVSETFETSIYSSEGIDETEGKDPLVIYPNPAKEMLNVEFSMLNSGRSFSLFIYSVAGVQITEIKLPGDQNEIKLNVESFQEGVYLITIKDGYHTVTTDKFIVTH